MAMKSDTERNVKVKIDGESAGMRRAAREAERELKRLQQTAEREQAAFVATTRKGADKVTASLATLTKGVLAAGSAAGSAQGLAGVAAAVGALSGAALAVPGLFLAGAAAVGTFKLATAGFSDAIAAEDMEEWTEATKNMAPEAVKTAVAVRDQRDRLAELRKTVQGRFFSGFDEDVRALADRYLPLMNKGLGDLAGELNSAGRASVKALMAPSAVEDVNQVLAGSRDLLHELEPAAGNVLGAILDLGGVGAAKAGGLGKAITGVTDDFREWVKVGVESGQINDLIDEGIDTAKDFGKVLQNLGQIGGKLWSGLNAGEQDFFDGIIETTQAVEDFLDSAEGQDAIRTLAETMRVTADVAREVLSAALKELGPIIRDVGPAVQGIARGVGEFLVGAIETVGPLLQGLARFLSENKDVVQDLTPIVLGLVVAYKGLKVATEVKDWMSGLPGIFDDVAKKAVVAGDAIGDESTKKGLAGRLGGLKALGAAAIITGAAIGLDSLAEDAKQADDFVGRLGNNYDRAVEILGKLLALDVKGALEIGADPEANANSPLLQAAIDVRGELNKLPPIEMQISVGVDDAQAQRDLRSLTDEIGRTQESVSINGNTVPAAVALGQVIDAIERGEGTVNIAGSDIDAHRALDDIVALINRSAGTVRVDGNEVPAGQVLVGLLNRVNGSRAQINLDASTAGAQGVIDRFITMNNGRTIQIYTSVLGSGGLASAGRLATGGPVYGPGTGTSDTAGLFALSNGEHVFTDAEVRAAGGHEAIFRLRRALTSGRITKLAQGGPAMPSYLSRALPSPRSPMPNVTVAAANAPQVRVFIGEREITDVVRTEIDSARRQDNRRASTGPGGAW